MFRYLSATPLAFTPTPAPRPHPRLRSRLRPHRISNERLFTYRSTVGGATLSLGKVLGTCWALTYLTLALGNPRYQTMADPSLLVAPEPPATRVAGGGITNAMTNSDNSISITSSKNGGTSSSGSTTNSSSSSGGSSGRSNSFDDEASTTATVAGTSTAADRVGSGGGGLRVIRVARQWAERRRRRRRLRRQENRTNRTDTGATTSAGRDPVVGASLVTRKNAVVPLPLQTPKRF